MTTRTEPQSVGCQKVLLLQGGGALGAYQAGACEALAAGSHAPDWVIGVSIGAINAGIIAGNAPEHRIERLRRFWHLVTKPTAPLKGSGEHRHRCRCAEVRQDRGAVVYIGSVHSKEASKLKGPYVTAKHGLIGLCKVLAKEGAEHNVRANVVCPGYVRTPLVDKQIPEQATTISAIRGWTRPGSCQRDPHRTSRTRLLSG